MGDVLYTVTRARRGVGLTPGITGMWLAWGAAHPGHHGRGCGPGCFYHARGAVHPGPRFDNMEYVIYINIILIGIIHNTGCART